MTCRKDELTTQIEELHKEITRLRSLVRKKEILKERQRLTKLMTDLILELSDLDREQ